MTDLERVALVEKIARAHSYYVVPRARREGYERVDVRTDGEMYERGTCRVIWSLAYELDGRLWLHASTSRPDRLPSYADMLRLHNVFVGDERYAYEVRAPRSRHVNLHPYCFHLWSVADGGPEPLPDFTRGGASI